jgi:hypothetical protein
MTTTDGHIFISYARADGSIHAADLQSRLEARGYPCWRDTRDLNRTQDFTVEIEKEIEDNARHVVVCLTHIDARDSTWVRREIAYSELCVIPVTPLFLQAVKPPLALVIIIHGWNSTKSAGIRRWMNLNSVLSRRRSSPPNRPTPSASTCKRCIRPSWKNWMIVSLGKSTCSAIPTGCRECPCPANHSSLRSEDAD